MKGGNYGVHLFPGVSVPDDNIFGDLKQQTFISTVLERDQSVCRPTHPSEALKEEGSLASSAPGDCQHF